jgi:hypothetical protein
MFSMSMCLTEVQAAADALSADEKLELISFLAASLRAAALARHEGAPRATGGHSLLDIPTVSCGGMLRPLTSDDDLLGEMLEHRV